MHGLYPYFLDNLSKLSYKIYTNILDRSYIAYKIWKIYMSLA